MIQIFYKPTFVRQYKKLSSELTEEVKEQMGLFRENPNHPFLKTHKLKGKLADFWSFSVNYKYRIVFHYVSEQQAVFLAIGDHDVYK